MSYMDIKTAARQWDVTERRLTMLCRDGRISGAKKEKGVWLIPIHSPKPIDGRKTKSSVLTSSESKLPMPIGISDFKKLVTQYYYVDKTLLIKEFLDARPLVSLFTRPRRFGKTLTMDMLKTFFEITDTDTSKYFIDKAIWTYGEKYQQEQGKYPVIFVTFKDVKFSTWEQTYTAIREIIATEYLRHEVLLASEKCNIYEKDYFRKVVDGSISEVSMTRAFQELSRMLSKHYNQPAIIILDEYDTPIQQGYMEGYYEQIINFMRNLLSGAFKDNSNLAYGFLTGILRVAKESIFSGLNNLKVHSITEDRYSKYFGFTKDEISTMLAYYDKTDKFSEILEWYDGYRFGNTEIFNPWSVLNYMDENCALGAYWQSTGDNSIIRQIVTEADDETADNLRKLMQGTTISSYIDTSVIYPEIKNNPTTVYSFLLAAGYLKIVSKYDLFDGNSICDIAIPNKEIFYVYEKEILSSLTNIIPQSTALAIQQAVILQDVPKLQLLLQEMLLTTISSFDYAHENFYHGLILGICAIMNNLYRVDSNRESGHGRYDIQLRPFNLQLPGIIIEIKVLKETIDENHMNDKLENAAKEALAQIEKKQYVTTMKQEGITHFFKIGISFYKKYMKLISRND